MGWSLVLSSLESEHPSCLGVSDNQLSWPQQQDRKGKPRRSRKVRRGMLIECGRAPLEGHDRKRKPEGSPELGETRPQSGLIMRGHEGQTTLSCTRGVDRATVNAKKWKRNGRKRGEVSEMAEGVCGAKQSRFSKIAANTMTHTRILFLVLIK